MRSACVCPVKERLQTVESTVISMLQTNRTDTWINPKPILYLPWTYLPKYYTKLSPTYPELTPNRIRASGLSTISHREVRQPLRGGANILFGQFFAKTAWKWKNFGPELGGGEEGRELPWDPPLRANRKLTPDFTPNSCQTYPKRTPNLLSTYS